MKRLEFWFELASTYSYLSAMRLPGLAAQAGVEVVWRPFLLGPIFSAQGWNTSPFMIYPKKGRYMWRDMERQAAKYGLAFRVPTDLSGFPQHSVLAARVTLAGLAREWGVAFAQAAYVAQFAHGADIADTQVLADILREVAPEDPGDIFTAAASPDIKAQLRHNTKRAQQLGIFGAPSFTIGEDLFWGDDRLEDALSWCART